MLCSNCEKTEKKMRETALQAPRSVKKQVGGHTPGPGAEIPLKPTEKTILKQVVPLQLMKVRGVADIHPAANGGDCTGANGYALKGATACGEPILQHDPGRNQKPWGTRTGAVGS